MTTPLDYSKWDRFVSSQDIQDDDSPSPQHHQHDEDEKTREYGKRWGLSNVLSHFVLVQRCSKDKADNVGLYKEITMAIAETPEVLEVGAIDALLDVALKASREGAEEAEEFVSAVNTLVAIREHGVVDLFHTIATPKDDAAKALRKKYMKREFAKEALFERSIGKKKFKELKSLVEESKQELDAGDDFFVRCCRQCAEALVNKCVVT